MLYRLFKRLYPSVFRYEEMFYEQRDARLALKKENEEVKKALQEETRKICLLKKLSNDNNLVTVKMIEDKGGKELLLTITETFGVLYNGFIDINVFDTAVEWKYRIGHLTATKYDDHLFIEDFKVMTEDLGIGSMMMNELIRYVEKRNVIAKIAQVAIRFDNPVFYRAIQGKLVHEDWDHVGKLKHFYSKLGFEVTTNDTERKGFIKKILNTENL